MLLSPSGFWRPADLNKNNIFDAGDVPISNTKIVLVLAAKKRVVRAANNNTVYGETTSDNEGRFVVSFSKSHHRHHRAFTHRNPIALDFPSRR